MERANPELIAQLLLKLDTVAPTKRFRTPSGVVNTPLRSSRAPKARCTCGQCSQCVENARWERIFAEKFADPNYYSHRLTRTNSPLSAL